MNLEKNDNEYLKSRNSKSNDNENEEFSSKNLLAKDSNENLSEATIPSRLNSNQETLSELSNQVWKVLLSQIESGEEFNNNNNTSNFTEKKTSSKSAFKKSSRNKHATPSNSSNEQESSTLTRHEPIQESLNEEVHQFLSNEEGETIKKNEPKPEDSLDQNEPVSLRLSSILQRCQSSLDGVLAQQIDAAMFQELEDEEDEELMRDAIPDENETDENLDDEFMEEEIVSNNEKCANGNNELSSNSLAFESGLKRTRELKRRHMSNHHQHSRYTSYKQSEQYENQSMQHQHQPPQQYQQSQQEQKQQQHQNTPMENSHMAHNSYHNDEFVLKCQFSALIPAFDPRPGKNNINQIQDISVPPNVQQAANPLLPLAEIEKIKQEYGGMLSAFLQAQYEQTQKRFKEAGITEVVLYRGIDDVALGKTLSDDKLTEVDVQSRPLSSWSTSDGTAYWFATGGSDSEASGEDVFDPESDHRGAVLLRRVVPVDQILSSSFTGVGSYDEQEMVIIGGEMKAEAVGAVKENKLIQVMREREGSTWNPLTGLETSAEKQERIEPGFENWNKEVEKIFEDWDNDLIAGVEIYDAGNILQANFIKKAGFNEKPKVLSQEEFDAIEAETVYRGHQSIAFMNNYIDSELQFASEGYFGNGTYTSNKRETAEAYAGGSGPDPLTQAEIDEHILEMKLLPDANVISFGSSPALREWAEEKTTEFLEGYEKSGANPAQYQEAEWRLFNEADYTNIAIMLGIDAIRFKFPLTDAEEYYTIIFNRGKVAINGKS